MEYFKLYGKMEDLFMWAFKKEYLEKSLPPPDIVKTNNEAHTGIACTDTYKFFTAFNYLYSIDNMLEFCKNVTRSFIEDKKLLDNIDTRLFNGNADEFTKEMNERYYFSLQEILRVIQALKNEYDMALQVIPMEYVCVLEAISKNLLNDEDRDKGISSMIFNRILKHTIITFLRNKRMLRRAFNDIDPYIPKLGFIAETLEKLLNGSTEPYILHINAVARNFSRFGSIDMLLERCDFYREKPKVEVNQLTATEMVSMMQCNILPINKMLSPTIRTELMSALQMEPFANDDFSIYTNVLRSFETFNREYYSYLQSVIDEEEARTRELERLKEDLKILQQALSKKRINNLHLKQKLHRIQFLLGKTEGMLMPTEMMRLSPTPSVGTIKSTSSPSSEHLKKRRSLGIDANDAKKASEQERKAEKKRKAEMKKQEKEEKKKKKEEEKRQKKQKTVE